MIVIKIMNDFLHSPIWTYEDGMVIDDLQIIENDDILRNLCEQASGMFAEYYEFDSHNQPCWFNQEKEKAEKEVMLNLIAQIVSRLNKLNDGSYVVEDFETKRLKAL